MLHATPMLLDAPRGGDVTGDLVLFGGTSNKRCVWRWLPQPITARTGPGAHACTQTDLEYVTPAPVIECAAPVPAVTYVVPSQQLPPVYTTTTVTTDDDLDMISLVYPQFSSTAVEPFAPRVVDSLLPLEEFTEPVYDQVHQEQIAASEMTENIAEIPVVQEQVIVGTRPERLVDARGPQGGLERAACPRYATIAFLLSQTLLAEKEAKEEEELVADLASKEQRLLVAVKSFARSWDRSSPLSHVEASAATWCSAKTALTKKGDTRQARAGYKYWPPR